MRRARRGDAKAGQRDAKAEARFAREIRALGHVEHPHLVKIFTSGVEGEQWFYAMELLEGATLAAISDELAAGEVRKKELNYRCWQLAVKAAATGTEVA